MKKFMKGMIVSFTIIFTILTILGFVYNKITYYKVFSEEIVPVLDGNITKEMKESEENFSSRFKEQYGKDAPSTILAYFQGYAMMEERAFEMQKYFLIFSILAAFVIEIAVSLTYKSMSKASH